MVSASYTVSYLNQPLKRLFSAGARGGVQEYQIWSPDSKCLTHVSPRAKRTNEGWPWFIVFFCFPLQNNTSLQFKHPSALKKNFYSHSCTHWASWTPLTLRYSNSQTLFLAARWWFFPAPLWEYNTSANRHLPLEKQNYKRTQGVHCRDEAPVTAWALSPDMSTSDSLLWLRVGE